MSEVVVERVDRAVPVLAAAAAVGVVAALWIVDYLPTHDGPQHLFLAHLDRHFDDPGAGFSAWVERGHPRTALGFNLLFSALERLFAWRTALRLTLTILALGWGFGHLALARAIHPRRAALGLLGFATAISWVVYMGLFSFAISTALGFATLAVAASTWPWTPRRRLAITALLSAQAVAHVFGAELTGLVLLAMVALAPAPASGRAGQIALLALMGLPALAVAATTGSVEGHTTEWLSLADHLLVLPRMFLPGPLWRAFPPLILALVGLVAAALRLRKRALAPAEIALGGVALLCLVVAFTVPLHLSSWEFFAPRFLPFGCLLGALLIPLEQLTEARRRLAVAGLALFTAASLLWAGRTHLALRGRVDEALAGLGAPIKRTGPRLVVPMDPFAGSALAPGDEAHGDIPYYAPLFNLGALYAVAQGGIPSYTFLTNPSTHPFVFSAAGRARYPELYDPADLRDPRLATDPAVRAALLTFLAVMGASFEDVVLHGRPEDGQLLADRGYVADFQRGGLFIGHFEGCPVTVELISAAPRSASILVEYGVDPLPKAWNQIKVPPAPAADGAPTATMAIKPRIALCGPSWLRATLDLDGSGGPSKGDRFCEGADPKGRMHLLPRRGQTIMCKLTP